MSWLHATALSGSSGYRLLTGHSLQTCDHAARSPGISNQSNKCSETCHQHRNPVQPPSQRRKNTTGGEKKKAKRRQL